MSTENIQSLFNRIAPVYDSLNDWLSLGQHRIWKQMTVKWSRAQPGHTCLDLCCGSGDLALMLARRVGTQGQVVGIDFAAAQLEVARQRSRGCPQLIWQEGNALAVPFAENSFDAVTVGYGLRNVSDIPACLEEIYRVLKPGAWAALLDFNRPESRWGEMFQQWYLQTIAVSAASHLGLTDEYAYLLPSLERFPTGKVQVQLAQRAGFRSATHYPIAADMMGVLVLQKLAELG